MRRLILFRHGKAVPHDAAPDFERGLTARGMRDSAGVGTYLAAEHILPDMALVSPALRTKMTWDEAKPAIGDIEVRYDKALYLASSDLVLRQLQSVPDRVVTLILVGHNPSLHDLAQELTGFGDRYALARLRDHMPTAAIVVLECDIDHWFDLAVRSARLERFRTPTRDEDGES
jgi:phosphohistidine phosphatase